MSPAPRSAPIQDGLTLACMFIRLRFPDRPAGPFYYGPYASFAPGLDGGSATCTAAESDLLANTYGDLRGAAYAASMRAFVADMEPMVKDHVERYARARARHSRERARRGLT